MFGKSMFAFVFHTTKKGGRQEELFTHEKMFTLCLADYSTLHTRIECVFIQKPK